MPNSQIERMPLELTKSYNVANIVLDTLTIDNPRRLIGREIERSRRVKRIYSRPLPNNLARADQDAWLRRHHLPGSSCKVSN